MSLREKESSIVCLKVSASVVVDESNPLHSVRVRGESERSVPFNLCVSDCETGVCPLCACERLRVSLREWVLHCLCQRESKRSSGSKSVCV